MVVFCVLLSIGLPCHCLEPLFEEEVGAEWGVYSPGLAKNNGTVTTLCIVTVRHSVASTSLVLVGLVMWHSCVVRLLRVVGMVERVDGMLGGGSMLRWEVVAMGGGWCWVGMMVVERKP